MFLRIDFVVVNILRNIENEQLRENCKLRKKPKYQSRQLLYRSASYCDVQIPYVNL